MSAFYVIGSEKDLSDGERKMFEFLRSAQLNVMFSLSSICGIITLFVLITGSLSRKRKTALILIEISAMLLLVFDRYAYIYRGDVSELGWWMVRICNFSVFALTVFIIFAFNLYLSDLMTCEGGLTTTPKRLKAVYVIAGIGELFVVANLFTGIYYTFDSTNRYSRSDGVVISFAIPILALLLQLSVIKSYGKKLSRIVRISLLLFTLVPLAVSILQFFIYGLSLTNISIVGMAILLYIFVLLDLNAAKEAKEEAEYENRAKSHFLANMSHEIRTPINAVLGMNEMILRESENPEIQAYADRIKLAGNTLLGLVNDILDFSKIEAGKMEILPVDYDVSSLLNDLVNMIQSRAEDKGLLLIPDFVETMPKILYGDEVRIKQIIMNILTNAVKYTEKGSITFHVGYERIEDEPENVYLNVSVTDTGIGIRPEDVEKLFHEFERIEEKRNRNIEGTGLGMNITRSLLEMMGSRLEVFSVYGEGSKFSFRLKQRVVSWEVLGDYEVSYRAAIAGRKKSKEKFAAPDAEILVTDDTAMNLEVFKNLLKRTCVQIDTASGGDECLSLTREKKYDVIFLDHMMPKKNGIETLRELRAQNDNPNRKTCVICLTANAISGAREHYLEAGFDDYLTKPIDVERLEDTLMRYLPQDKLQPPLEETAVPAPSWLSNKATILIADDDPVICMLAARILGGNFQVSTCDNGAKTQEKAAELKPDLILLDINLGDMSGFDVLRKLRERPETSEIPVMFITGASDRDAEIRGFRGGASDFVRKPFVPEVLLQRAQRIIALDHLQRNLRSEVRHQTLRAEHLTREMMLALSKAVDAKDHYTSGHSERVAAYSAEIARRMGKRPAEQERIYEMGLLHDIGKIGVPEELINKTSKLPESEFERIKRHTVTGSEILSFITEMPELAMGARSHHERYDGTGYPDGLKGENIPEAARIICLADCYDAMTSTRTYSKPGEQADVRAEIVRCAGTQFDPDIAKVLLAMIDEDKDYVMTERTADIHIWQGSDRLWMFTEEQAEGLHSTEGEDGKINEAAGLASPEGSDRIGQDGENTALRADADISSSNPDDEQRAMEKLRQLKEISIEDGLRYCGTVENYLDTLQIYTENAPASADEIEHLLSEGSLADTTVKVHAIKSMSRCIGAERIGELAEKLELAGKAGDAEAVGAGIGDLLARIRKLCEELQEV